MVRQAQSREKLLQKKLEEGLTEKPQRDAEWDFSFPDPGELPTPVLMIQDVSFAYPNSEPLYHNLDLGIDLQSRIALVGPNGAGKTTFVKLMTGELQPTSGAVRPHSHLRMAKFTQHFEDVLDLDQNALEWIHALYPKVFTKLEMARTWLGRYGCTAKQQEMPMKQLSDGQKARIVFAKLAMDKPHLLMLDEPTNHLVLTRRLFRTFPNFKLRRRRRRDAAPPRWRLHDHMRVSASREGAAAVSRSVSVPHRTWSRSIVSRR